VPESRQKRHAWGEDGRVDPDSLKPDDEERAVGPEGPTVDLVLRGLSIVPLLLVAALGLIAVVSWVLILVLGVGSGEPIWESVQGVSLGKLLEQIVVAILIGLAPLVVTVVASWAAARGFREDSSRTFWTIIQSLWGLAAVGLVVVDRARHEWLDAWGFSALDWWFAFSVVAFAMIVAGLRLRRAPRSGMRRR
jgi:hypothetical protein